MLVTGTEVLEELVVLGAPVVVVVVVVVVEGEEADFDDDEDELLAQAAFDSSPIGLGISAPASTLITDENAAFSLATFPCLSHAESRDKPGSAGRHSAPTSVQLLLLLAPVNVSDSANTFPSAEARTSSSVSVHSAVLASENTLISAPFICASEWLEGGLDDSRQPGSA